MNQPGLKFHIEENDYFGTLATVLDLVSQDLRKKGHLRNAETLLRQRDRLMHLQSEYRIEKIEPNSKDPQALVVVVHEPPPLTVIPNGLACH
jgi:hypothetical protein